LICAHRARLGHGRTNYRGYGLWIISEYLNYEKADLLIHNTVGEMAIGVLDQLSSRVPLGDWETIAYWVTGGIAPLRKRR
jgi:hypothetical protein